MVATSSTTTPFRTVTTSTIAATTQAANTNRIDHALVAAPVLVLDLVLINTSERTDRELDHVLATARIARVLVTSDLATSEPTEDPAEIDNETVVVVVVAVEGTRTATKTRQLRPKQ